MDTIELDNALGAQVAADHLRSLGHKRIAMISGPRHLSNSRNRLNGFRRALREAGVQLPKEHVEFGDFREASGRRAAEKILSLEKRPTALFVANNEMTAGALSALREQKMRIPDEISLVGFDDARWAQFSDPPLTIVAQPTSAMGKRSAELLLARIQKEKGTATEIFPARVCGPRFDRATAVEVRFRVPGSANLDRSSCVELGTRKPKPGT